MAKSAKSQITVTTGEKIWNNKSLKAFLFFLAPSGEAYDLGRCPALEQTSFITTPFQRVDGNNFVEGREMVMSADVLSPVIAKFRTVKTEFGVPRGAQDIYMEINKFDAMLRLVGFENWGEVIFRGKILFDRCYPKITQKQLEEQFQLEVIEPPKHVPGKTRNLMFGK